MNILINDSELLDAIFTCATNRYSSNLKVVFELSQPIMFQFNYSNETYLIYVLQDRTANIQNALIPIKELLISKVDNPNILKVLKSEISIYDAFLLGNDIWRIGQIGNKIYKRKKLLNKDEISNRFIKKNIFLKDLPNIWNI